MSEFEGTGTTVTTTIATTANGESEALVTEFVEDSYRAYPLTNIYTPECSSIVQFEDLDTECSPPDFDDIWLEDGYYSPGICYSGYTAGCSMTYRDIKPGQTAYNCVPIGWECSSYTFQAASINDAGDEITVPAHEIRWESSDLAFLETHPLSPEALTTDSSETGDLETGSRTDSDPEATGELKAADNGGGGGVPTGAAVGIAVGAAAFVALVCGAAFIWYRKRRQIKGVPPAVNSDSSSTEKPGGPVLYGGPPVMVSPHAYYPVAGAPTELVGAHYHTANAAELHGRDLLPELPPAEVDGTPSGGASPAEGTSPGFQVPRRPVGGEAGPAGSGT